MKMTKLITKHCSNCGVELEIIVNDDNSYSGGHFFGSFCSCPNLLTSECWNCEVCKKNGCYEYWECDCCFNSA